MLQVALQVIVHSMAGHNHYCDTCKTTDDAISPCIMAFISQTMNRLLDWRVGVATGLAAVSIRQVPDRPD